MVLTKRDIANLAKMYAPTSEFVENNDGVWRRYQQGCASLRNPLGGILDINKSEVPNHLELNLYLVFSGFNSVSPEKHGVCMPSMTENNKLVLDSRLGFNRLDETQMQDGDLFYSYNRDMPFANYELPEVFDLLSRLKTV